MSKLTFLIIMVLLMFIHSVHAESSAGTYILTSASGNIHRDEWKTDGVAQTAAGAVAWSVKKLTLHGGKQEGIDLIVVDNGKMRISVIPTRGMNILDVKMGDLRLGWDSPVKEVVHPQHIRLDSRGGLGWLEGFNEWMVRCGLEYAGHPGKDEFINNTGDKSTMDLTLHGKIANVPASEVHVIIDPPPSNRIRVRGIVHERAFYGPKLELIAELSTEPGSTSLRVEDTIKNNGAFEQEFQIIYHTNFGAPLLQKESKLVAPVKHLAPMNAHAAEGLDAYTTYASPTKGFVEQVFLLETYTDNDKHTEIMLQNAAADSGVSMRYSTEQLPYLTIWKNTAAIEDGYVTGLEPGTGYPFNRSIERRFGRVPKLAPGQSRSFVIDVGIHFSKETVAAEAAAIEKLASGQPVKIDKQPPTPPAGN